MKTRDFVVSVLSIISIVGGTSTLQAKTTAAPVTPGWCYTGEFYGNEYAPGYPFDCSDAAPFEAVEACQLVVTAYCGEGLSIFDAFCGEDNYLWCQFGL